jgi:hypothetical protein
VKKTTSCGLPHSTRHLTKLLKELAEVALKPCIDRLFLRTDRSDLRQAFFAVIFYHIALAEA